MFFDNKEKGGIRSPVLAMALHWINAAFGELPPPPDRNSVERKDGKRMPLSADVRPWAGHLDPNGIRQWDLWHDSLRESPQNRVVEPRV